MTATKRRVGRPAHPHSGQRHTTTVHLHQSVWEELGELGELVGVSRPDLIGHYLAVALNKPEIDPVPDWEQRLEVARVPMTLDMTA